MSNESPTTKKPRNFATTGGTLAVIFLLAGIFHEQLTPFFAAYIKLFSSPAALWEAVKYVVSSLCFSIVGGVLFVGLLGIPFVLLFIFAQKVAARLK